MTLRDELLPTIWGIRAIPGQLGLRPHAVSLVTTTWSGAVTGEGTKTVTIVPLVESGGFPPKVRWMRQEDVLLQGLSPGTCTIGPITPLFSGGGTDIGALTGASTPVGGTFHLLITGPQHPAGALYEIVGTGADHALHYTITASPAAPYVATVAPDTNALLTGGDTLTDGAGDILDNA